jgi:hypothetical protein
MNLKNQLLRPLRLDADQLQDLVVAAQAVLRNRGTPVPAQGAADAFEYAAQLAALLPDGATAPTTPTASAGPALSGSEADLLAGYERVKGDPKALGEFLAANAQGVARILDADRQAQATGKPAPQATAPRGVELLDEYERVKGDPVAKARFLASNAAALALILN